jgi:hypothetical protein
MACRDDAWHVLDGGDFFFIEERQKLVVLVWVGRYYAAAHSCGAG